MEMNSNVQLDFVIIMITLKVRFVTMGPVFQRVMLMMNQKIAWMGLMRHLVSESEHHSW